MQITVVINCDNAAFEDDPGNELENIFLWLSADASNAGRDLSKLNGLQIRDSNGNTVGTVKVRKKP